MCSQADYPSARDAQCPQVTAKGKPANHGPHTATRVFRTALAHHCPFGHVPAHSRPCAWARGAGSAVFAFGGTPSHPAGRFAAPRHVGPCAAVLRSLARAGDAGLSAGQCARCGPGWVGAAAGPAKQGCQHGISDRHADAVFDSTFCAVVVVVEALGSMGQCQTAAPIRCRQQLAQTSLNNLSQYIQQSIKPILQKLRIVEIPDGGFHASMLLLRGICCTAHLFPPWPYLGLHFIRKEPS